MGDRALVDIIPSQPSLAYDQIHRWKQNHTGEDTCAGLSPDYACLFNSSIRSRQHLPFTAENIHDAVR